MADGDENQDGVEAKNPNLDFIKENVETEIQHIVRADEDLKGVFNIEVQSDGQFNIKLHDGTESEARTIESVSKEKLLELLKSKL